MRSHPLALLLILPSCAMTPAGIMRTPVETSVHSGKTAQSFAVCVSESLFGGTANVLRSEGEHYWILRYNSYGAPVVRWDFTPTPDGSLAELRTSFQLGIAGTDKVRACA